MTFWHPYWVLHHWVTSTSTSITPKPLTCSHCILSAQETCEQPTQPAIRIHVRLFTGYAPCANSSMAWSMPNSSSTPTHLWKERTGLHSQEHCVCIDNGMYVQYKYEQLPCLFTHACLKIVVTPTSCQNSFQIPFLLQKNLSFSKRQKRKMLPIAHACACTATGSRHRPKRTGL